MIGISLKTAFSKYLPCAQRGSRISKWLRFPVGHIVSAIRAARGDKYGCTWVNVINTPECEAQTLSKRGGGSLLGCEWVCVCVCMCASVYVWVHGRAKDCQEKQKSHCLWLPWSRKAFASTGITRDTSSFWKPDRLHGLQHNKGPAVHQTHFLLILAASANIMLVKRKLFLLCFFLFSFFLDWDILQHEWGQWCVAHLFSLLSLNIHKHCDSYKEILLLWTCLQFLKYKSFYSLVLLV